MDNFDQFDDSEHMFAWADAPLPDLMRYFLEDAFRSPYPESALLSIQCLSSPRYLTGAKPLEEDENKAVMSRLAVAFAVSIEFTTDSQANPENIDGVAVFIAQNLDQLDDHQLRLEFHPQGDIDMLEMELETKIYES